MSNVTINYVYQKVCSSIKSVFEYEQAWVEMTNRVGFWIDMDKPYITLENDYIESVWWSLKEIWKKGWLYKGFFQDNVQNRHERFKKRMEILLE